MDALSLPTLSGWVFYLANLIIVSGYLTASLAITRRRGMAAGLSARAWVAGLSFFLLCGLTHVEMAIHAFLGVRMFEADGTISWHMLAIHIPQAASIWAFLWAMLHEPGAPPVPVPLEGAGTDPALETGPEAGP